MVGYSRAAASADAKSGSSLISKAYAVIRSTCLSGRRRAPRWMSSGLTIFFLLAAGGLVCEPGALEGQEIIELPVPRGSYPFAITQGPDGRMWFSELFRRSIGARTISQPTQEFPLPTYPGSICTGPDGNLWFTGARNFGGIASIVRMTTTGSFTIFPLPEDARMAQYIVSGPDGNLWFSEGLGHIGRISTQGVITLFPAPAGVNPLGITVGPDGALWFTEPGIKKIGRITVDGTVTEFAIPPPVGNPYLIAAGSDGALWFTQREENLIRRVTTTGVFSSFPVPTPNGGPLGIIKGPDGNIWFGEDAGKIGRLTPAGVFTEFPVPTPNSGVVGLTAGADGAVWFTEVNADQIGRIATGVCADSEVSLCLNGRRFLVSAEWSVPSQGTSGHGRAVPLTADTGYFWFFTANNVELTVKVVDGRAFNNRFWVFGGALSDVQYKITVRDTVSGLVKTYTNPQGTLASFADTNAF